MATFLKNTHKLLHNTTIRNTTDTPADHSYLAGQHKSIRKEIPRRGHPYLNATRTDTNRISHNSTKYIARKPLPEATRTSNAIPLKRPLVSRTAALNTAQGNPLQRPLAPQRENTSQRPFLPTEQRTSTQKATPHRHRTQLTASPSPRPPAYHRPALHKTSPVTTHIKNSQQTATTTETNQHLQRTCPPRVIHTQHTHTTSPELARARPKTTSAAIFQVR